MNKYQIQYFEIWQIACKELLGWEDEAIKRWAEQFLALMEKGGGLVIQRSAIYYVARELAATQTFYDQISQHGRSELVDAVEAAIRMAGMGDDLPQPIDFVKAKEAVAQVFKNWKAA